MVGGAIADSASTTEPRVRALRQAQDRLSPHVALQNAGHCHWHRHRMALTYVKAFDDLAEDNTHIIAIVLFRFSEGPGGEPVPNNYIVTAYQKEMG